MGYNNAAKKLSVDVGGAKRLHSLSTLVQALILGPWALIISTTADSQVSSFKAPITTKVICFCHLHICFRSLFDSVDPGQTTSVCL